MPDSTVARRHVRRHLEGALRELIRARPRLPRRVQTRREALVRDLARYIDAERYPINRLSRTPTPIFVDEQGARCAVAELLWATGHSSLVEGVRARHNTARVRMLARDPALAEWLAAHGLGTAEAARIQPAYAAYLDTDFQPTATVLAGAGAATTESIGEELTLRLGGRAGARLVSEGADDRGSSRYGSVALAAEYTWHAYVGRGGAHQLGLVLQLEPFSNSDDAQWYVVGGPLALLDGDDAPGDALGGQFGLGFSFRTREVPLFAELVGQYAAYEQYATGELALQLGAVW